MLQVNDVVRIGDKLFFIKHGWWSRERNGDKVLMGGRVLVEGIVTAVFPTGRSDGPSLHVKTLKEYKPVKVFSLQQTVCSRDPVELAHFLQEKTLREYRQKAKSLEFVRKALDKVEEFLPPSERTPPMGII